MTHDTWLVICDMWHMTDGGRNTYFQNLAPKLLWFGSEGVLMILNKWISDLMNERQRCFKNRMGYTGSVNNHVPSVYLQRWLDLETNSFCFFWTNAFSCRMAIVWCVNISTALKLQKVLFSTICFQLVSFVPFFVLIFDKIIRVLSWVSLISGVGQNQISAHYPKFNCISESCCTFFGPCHAKRCNAKNIFKKYGNNMQIWMHSLP